MIPIPSFDTRLPQILSYLVQLAEMESPSHDKPAVDRLGRFIAGTMSGLGAAVTVEPRTDRGDLVIARWKGNLANGGILLLFHIDTVYPLGTLVKQPLVERDGRLYGPGVLDMKGGAAVFFGAMSALKESGQIPDRPLTALFTTDEEIGSHASVEVIRALAKESQVVFCMEPAMPDGSLKTWRKGVGEYTITAHGKAAHAGAAHQDGRNAIEEIAHQVIKIQAQTDYEKGTTLNVGAIRGGTASNVVPAEAAIEVDMRVLSPGEAERVDAFVKGLQPVLDGTRLEVQGGINRPPMPRDERMVATFEHAREIGARLGLALTEGGTGGGSDANFVAPLGIPVLDGLGLVGANMHSEDEYVEIASIAARVALVAALLEAW